MYNIASYLAYMCFFCAGRQILAHGSDSQHYCVYESKVMKEKGKGKQNG